MRVCSNPRAITIRAAKRVNSAQSPRPQLARAADVSSLLLDVADAPIRDAQRLRAAVRNATIAAVDTRAAIDD